MFYVKGAAAMLGFLGLYFLMQTLIALIPNWVMDVVTPVILVGLPIVATRAILKRLDRG